MYLYEKMRERLSALSLINEPLPVRADLKFSVIWLGHLTGETFEVEIRLNAKDLGWMYTDAALLFFTYTPTEDKPVVHYECWLSKVKELAEEKLKAKTFSDGRQAGTLYKDASKQVLGYLDIKDVLAISGKI
jgi:hypothetical protein